MNFQNTILYRYEPSSVRSLRLRGQWTPFFDEAFGDNEARQETPIGQQPSTFRIVTYNIWFDAALKPQRTAELLSLLASSNFDVCCLQEATQSFEEALRSDPYAQKNWVITSYADQEQTTRSWYGTITLFRKEALWDKWRAEAKLAMFRHSEYQRCLLVLSLTAPDGKEYRIGNVHLDLMADKRRAQLEECAAALTEGTPFVSVLCGDTNIEHYDDLSPMFSAGFVDSGSPVPPSEAPDHDSDPALDNPTFGLWGVKIDGVKPKYFVRRIDYILVKGSASPTNYRVLGDQPIPREKLAGTGADVDEEMHIYASDHLGVCVDLVVN